MASNTFRSDPRRAAELACILTQYAMWRGADVKPHLLADAVAAMQKAARAAKRQAEHACNYGYRDDAHEARAMKRQDRQQTKLNADLRELMRTPGDEIAPRIELGGDPRGTCARLHIPGQRGDGWGEGFAIY